MRQQYEALNGKSSKNQSAGGKQLPLSCGNTFRMRPGSVPSLSLRVSDEVQFSDATPSAVSAVSRKNAPNQGRPPSGRQSMAGVAARGDFASSHMFDVGLLTVEYTSGAAEFNQATSGRCVLNIGCYPGLPHDLVEERRKRQAQRQKRAEARRKAEDEQRRERAAAKLAERESERLERLREKKYMILH